MELTLASQVLSPLRSTLDPAPEIHGVMPKHKPAVYPLEIIIQDFISHQRALAAEGLSDTVVLGPPYPLVQGFMDSEKLKGLHPVCQTLTDMLLTFGDIALPEKLAFMFVMFRNLRVCQKKNAPMNFN